MTQLTTPPTAHPKKDLPHLEAGDHLDQKMYHERYEAMPEGFRAERMFADDPNIEELHKEVQRIREADRNATRGNQGEP